MIWFTSSIIVGELFLFLILRRQITQHWAYFILCIGLFALSITALISYYYSYDHFDRIRKISKHYTDTNNTLLLIKNLELAERTSILTKDKTLYNHYRSKIQTSIQPRMIIIHLRNIDRNVVSGHYQPDGLDEAITIIYNRSIHDDIVEYNKLVNEIFALAQMRILLAFIITIGSIVQMVFGTHFLISHDS